MDDSTELQSSFRHANCLFQNTDFNKALHENLVSDVGDYHPPFWYNNHLGALISFGGNPNISWEMETLQTKDGNGEFPLHWYPHILPVTNNNVEKVIIYFPAHGQSITSVSKNFSSRGY